MNAMSVGNAVTTTVRKLKSNDLVHEIGAYGHADYGHWVFASVDVGGREIQDMMERHGFLAHVDHTNADDVLEMYSDEERLRDAEGMLMVFEYGASHEDYE